MLAIAFAVAAPGAIVDRIAVSVGDKIITQSEIEQRLRLSAFESRAQPDFSLDARKMAVSKLVEEKLIEKEMDLGKYPRADEAHRKELADDFEKTEFRGDDAAFAKALTAANLKRSDIEEDLGRQSDLLTFLNLRFRPAVQVTDQDVQKYFDSVKDAQKAALNEVRDQIEQKLTMERADKELDLWLADQKKRTRIEYMEKDLEPNK